MNLETLRSHTLALLRKHPSITSTDADLAINNAIQRLAVGEFVDAFRRRRIMRFPELEERADTTLVSGQETYTIPSTWFEVLFVEHRFSASPEQWFTLQYKYPKNYVGYQPASGRPYIYTWFEDAIHLRNVPSASEAGQIVRIWGYRLPNTLTVGGDSPEFQEVYHQLIPYLAAELLAPRYFDSEYVDKLRENFAIVLATIRSEGEHSDFRQGVRANGGGR